MGTQLIVPKGNETQENIKCISFKWTPTRMKAAELVARDEMTMEEITAEIGISMPTLTKWKQSQEFQNKIRMYREEQELLIRKEGIAQREFRVQAIRERWERLQSIIEARAEKYSKDPELQGVPGIETGLIIKIERYLGRTKEVRYEVDDKVLSYMTKLEEQIAKEVGDQKDVVNNLNLIKTYVGVSLDDL